MGNNMDGIQHGWHILSGLVINVVYIFRILHIFPHFPTFPVLICFFQISEKQTDFGRRRALPPSINKSDFSETISARHRLRNKNRGIGGGGMVKRDNDGAVQKQEKFIHGAGTYKEN